MPGGWWCCCIETCSVFSQGEWYADDPRSADWVNVNSEWDMDATSQWMQTTEDNAELICRTPSPTAAQCISATSGANSVVPAGRMRLLGNVTVDASLEPIDYIYAEFDFIAQSVSIGTKSGGVKYTRTGVTIPANDVLRLWITYPGCDGKVAASITAGTQLRGCEDYGWACITSPGGKYAGLGSGEGGASFDESETAFTLMTHTDAYDECCDCDCMCENTCIPMDLNFSLTFLESNSWTDCCPSEEGTMEFDPQTFGGPGPICAWIGSYGDTGYSAFCQPTDFWIYNPSQVRRPPVEDIKLIVQDELGGATNVTPHYSSSCCPFYLRYDFWVGWEHPNEDINYQLWCKYSLEITE